VTSIKIWGKGGFGLVHSDNVWSAGSQKLVETSRKGGERHFFFWQSGGTLPRVLSWKGRSGLNRDPKRGKSVSLSEKGKRKGNWNLLVGGGRHSFRSGVGRKRGTVHGMGLGGISEEESAGSMNAIGKKGEKLAIIFRGEGNRRYSMEKRGKGGTE